MVRRERAARSFLVQVVVIAETLRAKRRGLTEPARRPVRRAAVSVTLLLRSGLHCRKNGRRAILAVALESTARLAKAVIQARSVEEAHNLFIGLGVQTTGLGYPGTIWERQPDASTRVRCGTNNDLLIEIPGNSIRGETTLALL